jgi:phosphoribosylformylglycinamidine cyclo-ligase
LVKPNFTSIFAAQITKLIMANVYAKRGVSAQKEEVHAAVQQLEQGLYPNAFCKIYSDYLGGDDTMVNIMHADGAGTKSILAYMYWKQTGDISVWRGIAQDAIVMNIDDLLCVGVHDNIVFNSTIDRNKKLITGDALQEIIAGTQQVFDMLAQYGVGIKYLGGETADVGDVVRTVAVNGTMTCRWPKQQLITNDNIEAGNVIVGFASYGQATYEKEYNSGLASNGLTSARHDVLNKQYATDFPESFDAALPQEVVYIGKHTLTEEYVLPNGDITIIGKLLLSPTRTFAPIMKKILTEQFSAVNGLVHCSGGGQTKCLKYLPSNFKIIKDNLFAAPPVFDIIQKSCGSNLKEMYEVFNMGCRLELYCKPENASLLIETAKAFGVDAQIIGRVEAADKKCLEIHVNNEVLTF